MFKVYLRSQNKRMKIHHDSPSINVADKTTVQLLKPNKTTSDLLSKLNDVISHEAPCGSLFVGDYAPSDQLTCHFQYRCV